ncbi:MAG TPA: redoxin domain-containing protein, partial [Thermomicrobiaceae bacterium]|nr:redoxin domain-containing protein [Thermomicrobiaceae bacterium]
MQDRIDEFHRSGAEVFGISADSQHAAGVWAAAEGFAFPLLSDFSRVAMTAYGVKRDESDPYSV